MKKPDSIICTPNQNPTGTSPDSFVVNVGVTKRGLKGFAKQNLTGMQALLELTDNAIAATDGKKSIIEVIISEEKGKDALNVIIADWGCGMDKDALANALQIGSEPTGNSRINEHGFGLLNALSILSAGSNQWVIATSADGSSWLVVNGPFDVSMQVHTVKDLTMIFPGTSFALEAPRTVISSIVPRKLFSKSLKVRRNDSNGDLCALRDMIVEYLGITYRGFLSVDAKTMEPRTRIMVAAAGETVFVPAIPAPIAHEVVKRPKIAIDGQVVQFEYHYGQLDIDKRDHLIMTEAGTRPAAYHYLENMRTQGVDVRVGGRVIATALLGEIWKNEKGEPLARHPAFNDFVGEVIIPELPRGVLSTVNNKSGIDFTDDDWLNLFALLQEFPPVKDVMLRSEKDLRDEWVRILKAARPEDIVSDECSVWPTGTRIDVVDEGDGRLDLYELKVGKAEPQHLYQLRMYWDGLVVEGKQPTSATLLVQRHTADIDSMLEIMNKMPPPMFPGGNPSMPYQFKIATHAEKCLAPSRRK